MLLRNICQFFEVACCEKQQKNLLAGS